MSKVKIEGNASGTGTFTISAPNSNTDRNLTLPDGAGEILTDAYTGDVAITGDVSCTDLSFNSGYGSAATAYGCRAWVNFNGGGSGGNTVAIRDDGNVSSITDNSTGDYTVHFTTDFPDTNGAIVAMTDQTQNYGDIYALLYYGGFWPDSGSTRVRTRRTSTDSAADADTVNIIVVR